MPTQMQELKKKIEPYIHMTQVYTGGFPPTGAMYTDAQWNKQT